MKLLLCMTLLVVGVMSADLVCRIATLEANYRDPYVSSEFPHHYIGLSVYEWDVLNSPTPSLIYNQSQGCANAPTATFLNSSWLFAAQMPCDQKVSIPVTTAGIIYLDQPAPQHCDIEAGIAYVQDAIMVGEEPALFWKTLGMIGYIVGVPDSENYEGAHIFPEIHEDTSISVTEPHYPMFYHLIAGPGLMVLETSRTEGESFVLSFASPSADLTQMVWNTTVTGLPSYIESVVDVFVTDTTTGALTVLVQGQGSDVGTLSVYFVPTTMTNGTVRATEVVSDVQLNSGFSLVSAWNDGTNWYVLGADMPSPTPDECAHVVVLIIPNDGSSTSSSQSSNCLPNGVAPADVVCWLSS